MVKGWGNLEQAERTYLCEQVIKNKWTRKQLETYFTEKRTKVTKLQCKVGDAHSQASRG